jgi:ABC-2 type transport system permease protein
MANFVATLVRIAFLCRKELLVLFKEPANRVILLVPALMQSLLFGYAATYDVTNAPYALLDQSHSATSSELIRRLDASVIFKRIAVLQTASQIAGAIDDQDALLVVVVPPDLEPQLAKGESAKVQVILDGRNSTTAGIASAYVGTIISSMNASRGAVSRINIERRAWYNPNLDSSWGLLVGLIAGLSMLQTLLISALTVAREREQGTFDQLLVTPLTPMQILIGKSVPAILVGLAQSTIILLVIRFWFHVPMNGSAWLLYLGLLNFTVAAVGIGMSISALSLNMQQAMLYTFMLIMPLMLLSGLLTPVRNMPVALQLATYANPLRFGMDIVRKVYLEGAGLAEISADFLPMSVIAVVTLPLAAWLFRNRLS